MRGKAFAVQNAKQKAKTTKPRRKEELIHMKFTVEKRLLNEAVTNLQRAVSSKTSIPALEGILIRSEENRLILTAYDLEIGMQTELPSSPQSCSPKSSAVRQTRTSPLTWTTATPPPSPPV